MSRTGAFERVPSLRLRVRSALPVSADEPPGSWFLAAAACFVIAGIAVAAVRAVVPFAHGWWLVAYLVLVGGLAQALLGEGAPRASSAVTRWQLGLWNSGTVAVAVFDVLGAPGGVLIGSVALLAGLVLFTREAVGVRAAPPGRRTALFLLLVAFLAVSVVVGSYLAYALPGR